MHLSLHCHKQNDSCIKSSVESHFNVCEQIQAYEVPFIRGALSEK